MMPNKIPLNEDELGKVLVQCQCHSPHYLEVYAWRWDGDEPVEYSLSLSTNHMSNSLWNVLKAWWNHRSCSIADIIINDEDRLAIIEVLQQTKK